jgi:para-nitrobenzyl esterase
MKNSSSITASRRTILKGLGAVSAIASSMPLFASNGTGPVVQTKQGKLEGSLVGNVAVFKGVRYAQSIAGKNRFAPPQPVPAWDGVREAKTFSAASPQQPRSGGGRTPVGIAFADDPSVVEGDDCLALNIWAPAKLKGNLPVMVWFHGGGFSAGSGSSPLTHGVNLAGREDVIVVTINHRLAASGYVDFSRVLGGDFAQSSNLGTKDMVAALQWVNANIANFGGNPDMVTIFGESGGGWKVASVMGLEVAKNLVHRAVIQSGPLTNAMLPVQADEVANIMLEELGITKETAYKLHDISFQDVVAAEKRASARFKRTSPGFPAGFWTVLDGEFITDHVFDPLANATAKNIPLLFGQTGTEMSLFMLGDKAAYDLNEEQLAERLKTRFSEENAQKVHTTYRKNYPNKTASYIWFRVISDITMGALMMSIGKAKTAAGGAPVYSYRFEYESPIMDGKLYSPHTLEIPYVFDTAAVEGSMITGGGDEVAALAKTVSSVWVEFAKTGKPGAPGMEDWPVYTPENLETMHLDVNCTVGHYIDPTVAPIIYDALYNPVQKA